jgi:hypothetical protein
MGICPQTLAPAAIAKARAHLREKKFSWATPHYNFTKKRSATAHLFGGFEIYSLSALAIYL